MERTALREALVRSNDPGGCEHHWTLLLVASSPRAASHLVHLMAYCLTWQGSMSAFSIAICLAKWPCL